MNCAFWSGLENPGVENLIWRHLAKINAKQPKFAQNSKGWLRFLTIKSQRSIMDFHNFYTVQVFKVTESTADILTELPWFEWTRKSKSTSDSIGNDDTSCFWKFHNYSCFWDQGIHCQYFYRATLFELLRKSRSTSCSTVPQGYWWLYLMDFHNFFTFYVFEDKDSLLTFLKLGNLSELENPSELPVWFCLVNFWNFHTIRVFEVRKSIADISI